MLYCFLFVIVVLFVVFLFVVKVCLFVWLLVECDFKNWLVVCDNGNCCIVESYVDDIDDVCICFILCVMCDVGLDVLVLFDIYVLVLLDLCSVCVDGCLFDVMVV